MNKIENLLRILSKKTKVIESKIITKRDLLGYREYVGVITQEGTNAPVCRTIINDFPSDILSWNYNNVGQYQATMPGFGVGLENNYTSGKVLQYFFTDNPGYYIRLWSVGGDGNQFVIWTNEGETPTNNALFNSVFSFRIYD